LFGKKSWTEFNMFGDRLLREYGNEVVQAFVQL
jgi:hypothetical protein